ncbi:hypothetical protein YK48G_11720 [Lentilactobacillus fungorum]|uniref:Uncharacterized protein n=1 Tax=Lentilactobacillus fungorum TaxID=2201250 RepID=A0ABQ3VXW6_9LACO|nr:hypothetical protein YK48G_11720 [Lentilactobacillus fungorum]
MELSAWHSCPKKSERSKALRDRSVRLLCEKFPGLEFFAKVLTRRSLLCVAVLKLNSKLNPKK